MVALIWALIEGMRYYPTIVERGWWRHQPFLPLPPERYIKFRLDTAYGMVEHGWERPPFLVLIRDVYRFLLWRRKFRLIGRLVRQ